MGLDYVEGRGKYLDWGMLRGDILEGKMVLLID